MVWAGIVVRDYPGRAGNQRNKEWHGPGRVGGELEGLPRRSGTRRWRWQQSTWGEAGAEFLGTFVLIMFGDGVVATCVAGAQPVRAAAKLAFGQRRLDADHLRLGLRA